MSLIQGTGGGLGGAGAPGGSLGSFYSHLLDQSLKFNDDDSQRLTRTPASAGNRQKFTLSFWMKRGNLSSIQDPFSAGNSGTDRFEVMLNNGDHLQVYMNNGGAIEQVTTTQVFRDVGAWYHIVLAFDTTDATEANRLKVYVNGSQVTDFSTYDMSTANFSTAVNSTSKHYISGRSYNDDRYLDGYLAEINLIDGAQLTPASFGETKDGIWIPKDTSGLTFGTNGFHLTFKDDVVSEGFNTVTYTGNGGTQSISGLGFKPDGLVWIKERSQANQHVLIDSVRGISQRLESNNADAEVTMSPVNLITSIDADGFSLSSNGNANENNQTYVGWCWEAGGIPTATNSAGAGATPTSNSVKIDGSNLGSALAGTIAATRLSANTARGFSIVSYTGNGTNGTIAHGLSSAPTWIIVKNRDDAENWAVWHSGIAITKYLRLNDTPEAKTPTNARWNDTAPTSTVFSVGDSSTGDNEVNANNDDYIAYCWTDISGYSKFGTYSGNGSSTGPTVTTGFRPAMVIAKRTDSAISWVIFDNTRDPGNPVFHRLNPNSDGSEGTNVNLCNFTDTGFAITTSDGIINADGGSYIYMAFADTREAAFFKDVTTNGNNFTPVNLDYRDSVPDTPTNNFATLNPLVASNGSPTLSEGNLKLVGSGTDYDRSYATMGLTSGKWYAEFLYVAGDNRGMFGVVREDATASDASDIYIGSILNTFGIDFRARAYTGTGSSSNGQELFDATNYDTGDIGLLCFDIDNGKLWFGRRDVSGGTTIWYDSNGANNGDPSAGSNPTYTGTYTGHTWFIGCHDYNGTTIIANFGQDGSFSGSLASQGVSDANGIGDFNYIESGFLALCSQNLPDVDIIDGTDYFETLLYSGNSSTQSITSLNFSPDFVWTKRRSASSSHYLSDSVRGGHKILLSEGTGAEYDGTSNDDGVESFDSNGFTLKNGNYVADYNATNSTYVAWNWLAGGTAPAQTYAVTVSGDSGANKYRFDGNTTDAPTLNLQEGGTYTFDQSHSSNSGHPLRFSTTSNGTHASGSEYTTGVTTTGTPGSAGAKTVITVAASAATLYYYCSSHSGMGGQVNTNATFGSTRLDGSILSTVSANTEAGFSIVSLTTPASGAFTFGHGLGVQPDMIIAKGRETDGYSWLIYHRSIGAGVNLVFSPAAQAANTTVWQNTNPSSSIVYGNSTSWGGNEDYIAYCFASTEGYSKAGSYIGGSSVFPFVFTGFRPAWVLLKRTTDGSYHWRMYDSKRSPFNDVDDYLTPNLNFDEKVGLDIDFLSNGFKIRTSNDDINDATKNYVYLAFAEQPFKFANAR